MSERNLREILLEGVVTAEIRSCLKRFRTPRPLSTDVMQPGPAVSTRARAALGDISNRGLAGGLAGKAGGKVRRPPVPNYPAPGN